MKVDRDNIWLCSDCTMVACNGTRGVELANEDATVNGLAKLGPHLVPAFDSETEDGIRHFTDRICEACGTSLAGYRAKFATLVEA